MAVSSISQGLATQLAPVLLEQITINSTGCWVRTQGLNRVTGYTTIHVKVEGAWQKMYAHRLAYIHFKGPIPDGLTIDHLCRTPACINPDHLEAVSQRVNILRGGGPAAINAAKMLCKEGHELTQVGPRKRACKTCRAAYEPPPLSPDDPRHGTANGYQSYGCRCSECRRAHSEYNTRWRRRANSDIGVPG